MSATFNSHYKNDSNRWKRIVCHYDNKNFILFLACYNQKPVGTISLFIHNKTAFICNAAVLPSVRNKGVGTSLINYCIVKARKLKLDVITALLMPDGMAKGICQKIGLKEYMQIFSLIYLK